MKAYFCSGIYHLFNVINMQLMNENEKSDCYIFNCFIGAEERYKKLKEANIFNEVFLIQENPEDYIFVKKGEGFFYELKKTLQKSVNKLKKGDYSKYKFGSLLYDEIFVPGYYPFLHRYLMVLAKNNKKINFYDEGLGCRIDGFSKSNKKLLGKILKIYNYEKAFNNAYMYNFEQVEDNFKSLNKCLITNYFKEKKELFYKIFNVKKEEIEKFNKSKIVILPTGISYEPRGDNSDELLVSENKLYDYVIDNFDNIVLKNHPGSTIEFPCTCIDKSIPFELLCACEDLEDKIFLTSFSTTIFNIKYLFDKEPNIILLYKVMNLPTKVWFYRTDEESDLLMKRFLIDAYTQKERVFIPQKEEEFKKILKELTNETKN